MATHDYVIANGTGAAVRSDLNNALAAIVSNNSSSSEPGTRYAYQFWADTNANVLKIRNAANDGWITLRELDGTMLIEDGSASTPGLAFADDVNTGIFSPAADQIGFATGGAERLEIGSSEVVFNDPSNDVDFRVESNGNTHMLFVDAGNDRVGIGTTSPNTLLHLETSGTGNSEFTIKNNNASPGSGRILFADQGASDAGVIQYEHDANVMVFKTNANEAARLDSSGRVLVGTSSARTNVLDGDGGNTLTPQFQLETANSDTAKALSVIFGRNNSNGAEIVLGKHRSASVGGTTIVSNGDQLGSLTFSGSDGTNFIPAATIEANVDGTPGSNDMPGRLVFSTTADGANSPTETMRIGNNGETTLRPATYGMGVRSIAGSSSVNTAYFGAHSSTSMTTGTITFEVYTNGDVKNTNNSYGQLSDERLKENIINAPSQWDDIKSLQIRKYNFRDGNGYDTHTQIGLVAQEVQTVCPGLVQETPVREDATPVLDAEGNELEATKSVLTSVLYMKAVKALQEAQTRIEALETQNTAQQTTIDDLLARVTALEAA